MYPVTRKGETSMDATDWTTQYERGLLGVYVDELLPPILQTLGVAQTQCLHSANNVDIVDEVLSPEPLTRSSGQ
jgi:hypothetical protein